MRGQSSYTDEQVIALLDSVFDDEFLVMAARAEQEGSSRGDPALGNTIAAMVADIKRAWATLTPFEQDALEARYKHGLGFDVIAFLAGLDGATEAAHEVDWAIARMMAVLNRFEVNE